uniref:Cilia and flagella-associated protein 410 n=1 Tax=Xenopus tropicalis TaxID=8364 RepID=F6SJV5_XENTR
MKLTHKQVLSRAKASDLENVRKLNCCVNNISTLEPIRYCHNLAELYLRKNNISSLNELYYLKELPRLKILWLSENPCCGADPQKYRMTVLRNLPNLQKLDNQVVTEEELTQALTDGEELTGPQTKISNSDNSHDETSIDRNYGTRESENDLLNFSMEETNKIREQLGMKPLPRDKFSSFSSPTDGDGSRKKRNNILNAVLLLLKDLDTEGLEIVQRTAGQRLHQLKKKELQQET